MAAPPDISLSKAKSTQPGLQRNFAPGPTGLRGYDGKPKSPAFASKLAVARQESYSLVARFLKPEIGMKRYQEPSINPQTKEMVARTLIGNDRTHADGQAIHAEKAAAERQKTQAARKLKSRRATGGTGPTCMG